MYKCVECKQTFYEPKTMSAEAYYDMATTFGNSYGHTISMCPYCDGAYEEFEESDEELEDEETDLLDETNEA